MKELGVRLSMDDLNEMMSAADMNQDGRIDYAGDAHYTALAARWWLSCCSLHCFGSPLMIELLLITLLWQPVDDWVAATDVTMLADYLCYIVHTLRNNWIILVWMMSLPFKETA